MSKTGSKKKNPKLPTIVEPYLNLLLTKLPAYIGALVLRTSCSSPSQLRNHASGIAGGSLTAPMPVTWENMEKAGHRGLRRWSVPGWLVRPFEK